jgi:Uma2 family endonuclease
MGLSQPKIGVHFTVQDYLSWPEGERWELIYGEAWAMTPAPSVQHQRVVLDLATRIKGRIAEARRRGGGGACEVFVSPIDVVLAEDTVVQPDLVVVCDPGKVRERIEGPPDLVVEVLSPGSAARDRWTKRLLYERFGVREYLLVDPLEFIAEIYVLGPDGKYGSSRGMLPGETISLLGLELGDLGEILGWKLTGEG